MGLSNKLPDLQEVDVIIAGGGAAGCVLAGRLAAASPSLSILCVEYGPDNYNDPTFTTPGFMLSHLDPSKKTTLFYKGAKSPSTGNRDMVVPSGGVLGGGSSVNFMMYSRAQRSDFDAWDMPGWSADEIMPYLRKLETFHGPDPLNSHGHDGPIQVSKGTWGAKRCQDDFINAIGKLGYPEMDDLQSLSPGAINGVQRAMKYISPDGKRSDAAHAYVHPRLTDGKHPNLHVVVETQVDKVIIENGRAVGVQVLPNPSFHPEDTRVRTIRAKKLVVVSAGACGTPLILERSGVGDPAVLGAAGVDVTVDLPGVGNGYEDHLLQVSVYHTSLGEDETIDAVTRGQRDVAEMMRNNHPMLGWNVQDITCKLRPSDDEVAALGPAFQKAWNEHFRDIPDKPMTLMSPVSGYPGDPSGIPPGQYIGLTTFSVYPFSRGHIHITGPSPSDEPNFDTGFFADPDSIDILKSRWAYKKSREIMRRMSVYRGELASMHPPFQPDSAATCAPVDSCDPETVQDISYSEEDDRIIDEWLRKTIGTTWHSMGTCKMASREKKGVVDEHLSVYGVSGLKVVDLSIAPKNIGANTNNTALAIGERAADIIIKELGL